MSTSKKREKAPSRWVESEEDVEVGGGGGAYDDLGIRPQVARVSSRKKTAVVNFLDICRLMRRQPKHVLTFLSAELSLSGSIDSSNKLVFHGRLLRPRHVDQVLRSYVREYVECRACLSAGTVLQKDAGAAAQDVLQCEACRSRRPVASIRPELLSQAITVKKNKAKLSDRAASGPKATTKRKRKAAKRWIFLYTLYLYLHFVYCVVVLGFGLEPGIQSLV